MNLFQSLSGSTSASRINWTLGVLMSRFPELERLDQRQQDQLDQPWEQEIRVGVGDLWRRLVLPPRITRWSFTSLQQRLVKTGGRVRSMRDPTGSCWQKGI